MNLRSFIALDDASRQQCFRLRYDVNVGEGKKSSFLCHDTQTVVDDLDATATIHAVEHEGRIIGTMRSVYGGDRVPASYQKYFHLDHFSDVASHQIGFTSRLVIDRAYRKTMALPMLLGSTYNDGRRKGVWLDFMHCAPSLIGMYEKLGYQCYAPGIAHTDVGSHVPMLLLADDKERLKMLGSPFGMWASTYPANEGRATWFRDRFPDYADGVTPVLNGARRFVDSVHQMLSASASHLPPNLAALLQLRDSVVLARAALVRCRQGDVLARALDGFSDAVLQMSGRSLLHDHDATGNASTEDTRDGPQLITDFLHRNTTLELVCLAPSTFLVIPRKEFLQVTCSETRTVALADDETDSAISR